MYVFHFYQVLESNFLRNVSLSYFCLCFLLSPPFSKFNQPFTLMFRWNIGQRKRPKRWHMLDWSKLLVFKGRDFLLTHILVLSRRYRLKRGNMFVTVSSIPRYLKLWRRWKRRKQLRCRIEWEEVAGNLFEVACSWNIEPFFLSQNLSPSNVLGVTRSKNFKMMYGWWALKWS